MTLDFDKSMSMGDIDTYVQRIVEQDCFNGSVCDKCYYTQYNNVLSEMLDGNIEECHELIKHIEFV